MPPSTYHVFGSSVQLSVVRQLTPISRDSVPPYLVDGFQKNLPQIFIMCGWNCWKGSQGQRSKVKVIFVYKCV